MISSTGRPRARHLLFGLLTLLAGCRAEQATFSFGPPLPTVEPVATRVPASGHADEQAVAQAPETPPAPSRWPRPTPVPAAIAWPPLPRTGHAGALALPAGGGGAAYSSGARQPALAPANVQAPQSLSGGIINIGIGAAAIVGGSLALAAGEDNSANDQKTASLISKLLIGFGVAFIIFGLVLVILHIKNSVKKTDS